VSWRIYQDPNDNWSGLMHGGLAFKNFREATAASGGPLYENGMSLHTLADLQQDVMNGTLPQVSWILPSAAQSEHPGASSSDAGGYFVSQVLDAITANPSVWSQTAMFVPFDENDGYFDHVPPPAVPSLDTKGVPVGGATLPLAGEYFDGTGSGYLNATAVTGSIRPWGMGARVPMFVISPWSRGGWVNSQVFDHSSIGMFLEKRFGVSVESISPWRRAVSGDLTSAFNFAAPNGSALPTLPNLSNYPAVLAVQATLPTPSAPSAPQPLFQERGIRPSRALPYVLATTSLIAPASLSLTFVNSGTQGAVFHVYDQLHLDRIPRRYTAEAGKAITDAWPTAADDGAYDLWVYGPNGFVRTFAGNTQSWSGSLFRPETLVVFQPARESLLVQIENRGTASNTVTVTPTPGFSGVSAQSVTVPAGATVVTPVSLRESSNWYDFTASDANFSRRFAGRMETGKDGISNPAIASTL
jgi:phospholipase C